MLVVVAVVHAWNVLLNIALYPSTWLHERTHYAVLRPYVTDARHDYTATQSEASITLAVSNVPRWRYVLGALAPTLVGLLLATTAVLVSFTMPELASRGELLHWLLMGAYWFAYTIPSVADIQGAAQAATQTRGGRA